MRRLPSIILFVGLAVNLLAQSPHGADLKVNCASCHTSDGWEIPFDTWKFDKTPQPKISKVTGWEIGWDTSKFNHNATNFALSGQHARVDCRSCHETLVFSEASLDCISCHTDMHNQTVGTDCARCHNTENWLVDNITELHQDNGFPLMGAHAHATCTDCHKSGSALRFDRIGNDCINCHTNDYMATANPNHQTAGFSTNCAECHDLAKFDWTTDKVKHDFFPLTKGHDISDCAKCHTNGNYTNTPATCVSCHKTDYETAINPNHTVSNFSQNCIECHTTDPDWMPATYMQHDAAYFPIYSGAHKGEWDKCADCHTNPSNYAEFTCITCHKNPETDDNHSGINGYVYNSPACLACHPAGDVGTAFDHNSTNFPLTGAHQTTACIDCHASGYAGTPTNCASCHTTDYNQSANPSHTALAIPTDCASCHTTAGWEPATFAIHNNYYQLNGAHAAVANQCATCHNGDYNNTPNTCAGCHTADYNQTTNPSHSAAQFPMDCAGCHGETAWAPATFDHDGQHFPIYSGKHKGEWDKCADCHTNPSNFSEFTCTTCHTNPETNNKHNGINGYAYNSPACLACHPAGDATGSFDHNTTNFPLKGAHQTTACIDCHASGYAGTPTNCASCHTTDYNQTNDPNHASAGFPTDCKECHSETAWAPSNFDHDGMYFPIYSGKHKNKWDQCSECHTNPSNYAVFSCTVCHTNPGTNNDHQGVNGYSYSSPACLSCHPDGN